MTSFAAGDAASGWQPAESQLLHSRLQHYACWAGNAALLSTYLSLVIMALKVGLCREGM